MAARRVDEEGYAGFQQASQSDPLMAASSISQSRPSLALRLTNVFAFIAAAAVHAVWWALPLVNKIPDVIRRHDTPLSPPIWIFWIWVLIYALQAIGVVYQALPRGYAKNKWKALGVNAIGIYWQLGWYANILWEVFLAQTGRPWLIASFCMRLLGFIFIGIAYLRLHAVFSAPHISVSMLSRPYMYLILPTVIDLAWLSFTSAMTVLIVMESFGIGFSSKSMKIVGSILAGVVALVGLVLEYLFREVFYGLTLSWAFIGVITRSHYMQLVSIVCMILTMAMVVVSILRKAYGLESHRENGGMSDLRERLVSGVATFSQRVKRAINPGSSQEEGSARAPLKGSAL